MAFTWDKERISNEDVMKCAADYMEHISSGIFPTSSKTTNLSCSPEHHIPSSSPLPSSSAASSPTDSTSSGWNWFGWFSFSSASTSDVTTLSSSTSSVEQSSQSYGSWLWSWITWSTPTDAVLRTKNVNVDGNVRVHEACESPPLHEESSVVISEEQKQRQEKLLQMTQHLEAQLKEEAAQRPLVGLFHRKDWRDMNIGPRLIEHALEKIKTKAAKFWREKISTASALLEKRSSLESSKEDRLPGSSIPDLANIGGGAEFYQSETKDLYKLYMQVDWDGKSSTEKASSKGWFHSYLRNLDRNLADYCSEVQSSLEYFQEELLFEGLHGSFGPTIDSGVEEAVKAAVDKGLKFGSDTFASFPSKVRLKWDVTTNQSCGKKTLDFSLKLGLDHFSFGAWKSSERKPVKLVVLTEKMARIIYVPSSTISMQTSSQDVSSDLLSDWECINKDTNYVAYRRLYKNTGLYQYKVIGQYDDITAKDFVDVQVNHNLRKEWDSYAGDLDVVETDQLTNCKLIHWIMKYPLPWSHREYLFVQRVWTSENNDLIVVMNKASSHPSVQLSRRCVHVSDYFSDTVIQADSTVDKPGMKFELTYFDNPKSNLPSSCVNWVTFSALPDFLSKIHTAATAHREVQINL